MIKFIDKVIPKYEIIGPLQEGLILVRNLEEKYGFVNEAGELIIPCTLNFVRDFSDGLALIRDENNLYGYIDKTGKEVIPCKYLNALSFTEGLACVRNEEYLYGFIDKSGKLVIPYRYKNATVFSEGLAAVQNEKGLWGYIDYEEKVKIPFKFKKADAFSEGLACVVKKDLRYKFLYGYIDKEGKTIIPFIYRDGFSFANGVAGVHDKAYNQMLINKENQKVEDVPYGYWYHCFYAISPTEKPSVELPCKYASTLIFGNKKIEITAETEEELDIKKRELLEIISKHLSGISKALEEAIKSVGKIEYELTDAELKEIFDHMSECSKEKAEALTLERTKPQN